MRRVVVWGVLLGILGVLAYIGGQSFPQDEGAEESSRINSYLADFTVHDNGDVEVTETLVVEFPVLRHGIFRFFDLRDPNDDHARLVPEDIEVTRDGREEPFEVLTEGDGRYRNIKIGDPDKTIYNEHTYVIRYRVPGVLLERGEGSRFHWNLVPQGWRMPIESVRLRVELPEEPTSVSCDRGQGGTGGCTAQQDGNRVVVRDDFLAAHTPITLTADLPMPAPERAHTVPWTPRWDGVLGQSVPQVVLIAVLALGAGALGLRLARSTREKQPPFPLTYAPPEGIGPAQAAYLLDEKVDNRAFVATMLHAAEKDAVTLEQSDGDWEIAPRDPGALQALDPVTATTLRALGADRRPFLAARKDVAAGKTLKDALGSFRGQVKSWAHDEGLMSMSGLGSLSGVVVLGGAALAVFVALWNPLGQTLWAFVPGAFAVLGLELAYSGAGTKRTPKGRELWSRLGGFRRILSTPSAEARFDFAGRQDLYTAYLPWAVAFDCADAWAKKYRVETGAEPPAPHYFGGYAGVQTVNHVDQMVGSFDSAVSSAISAYQATQSSSGGGGGGGGSGGGGGGGGSW